MTLDEKILQKIIETHESNKLDFILCMGNDTFNLKNVSIIKSSTPVNAPTKRGGVYFSDTFEFKIKAQTDDLSLAPLLSKSMLGPSTDFQDLEIFTHAEIDKLLKKITFFVHLTNSMQSSSYLELNMTIVKIKSE